MAKKKPVGKRPQSEIGNELHTVHEGSGYKYHATFTPTWRTELDCGEHDTLKEAQQSVVDIGKANEVDVIAGWHRETPDLWTATGWDGQVETLLTIAKIERVAE